VDASKARVSAIVIVLLLIAASGCVRRRLTIRSDPPGAVVYVDDQQIGSTPVSTEFTYYGTRKLKLVKDGYETLTTLQAIRPPWYQYPPLDFVTENLVPQEYRDERILEFQLQPQRIVSTQELLTRADNLRGSAARGFVAPIPAGARGSGRMTQAAVPAALPIETTSIWGEVQ
jgi:hypothetical protein